MRLNLRLQNVRLFAAGLDPERRVRPRPEKGGLRAVFSSCAPDSTQRILIALGDADARLIEQAVE